MSFLSNIKSQLRYWKRQFSLHRCSSAFVKICKVKYSFAQMYTILIISICILCISAFCHLSTCIIIHMKLSTSIYNIHMDLSTCIMYIIYTILMNLLICISYKFVDSPLCSAATLSPRWSPCSLQDSANQQVRFHLKKKSTSELTISFFKQNE